MGKGNRLDRADLDACLLAVRTATLFIPVIGGIGAQIALPGLLVMLVVGILNLVFYNEPEVKNYIDSLPA